ncbi:hypothetical protein MYXO_02611 [Myxococcaceae bacterium]|jgi:uncharacterized protein YqgC (DUF456 family)|nr:hypothetical protein MYXO_02611 [Myxococcaceae bacterium]
MLDVLLWILVVLLVLAGLLGTIVPGLPGAPLVLAGLVLAGWIESFAHTTWLTWLALGLLGAASLGVDLLASVLGAQRVGASPRALVGATLGAVVGLFFGLPGLVLGPFVGAVLGEYSARRNLAQAGRAGVGTFIGLVLGAAAKAALALAMVTVFAAAYLF